MPDTSAIQFGYDLVLNSSSLERQVAQIQGHINRIQFNPRQFALGKFTGDTKEFSASLDVANQRVAAFSASVGTFVGITSAIKNMVSATIDFEKRIADINVILNASSGQIKRFGADLFDVAKSTGKSFAEVSDAALEFSRQGLGISETLKRTRDAMIAVRLSGVDTAEAVRGLTAAINTFDKEALDTTQIINKLAAVDAAYAVSTRDLIQALGRVGNSAQEAGVDFDKLLGIITGVQQKTQRGGEVISNAIRTIFVRLQRTDTLAALENLGITVRDVEGNFVSADRVLSQLAQKFNTLTDSQKAYTSELVAGNRQVNILQALLRDLASSQSVVEAATNKSSNATNEAVRRNELLNQTTAATLNKTLVSIRQASAAIGTLTVKPTLDKVLGIGSEGADFISKFLGKGDALSQGEKFGANVVQGIFKGIGSTLGSTGLLAGGLIFGKLFAKTTGFVGKELGGFLTSPVGQSAQKAELEKQVASQLQQQIVAGNDLNKLGLTREQQAEVLLNASRLYTAELEKQIVISQEIADIQFAQGIRAGTGSGYNLNKYTPKASGFLPALIAESQAISKGVGGANSGAIPSINSIRTDSGIQPVVVNNSEKIIRNFMGSGRDAVFNRDMMNSAGGDLGRFGTVEHLAAGNVRNLVEAFDLAYADKANYKRDIRFYKDWNKFSKFLANRYESTGISSDTIGVAMAALSSRANARSNKLTIVDMLRNITKTGRNDLLFQGRHSVLPASVLKAGTILESQDLNEAFDILGGGAKTGSFGLNILGKKSYDRRRLPFNLSPGTIDSWQLFVREGGIKNPSIRETPKFKQKIIDLFNQNDYSFYGENLKDNHKALETVREKYNLPKLTIQEFQAGTWGYTKRLYGDPDPVLIRDASLKAAAEKIKRQTPAFRNQKEKMKDFLHGNLFAASGYIPYASAFSKRQLRQILESTAQYQGVTMNRHRGSLAGQPLYAVSLFPDLTENVSSNQLSLRKIKEFTNKHSELLRDSDYHSFGTWHDKDTGKVSLDVSSTLSDSNTAKQLGNIANQKAIFNLKNLQDVITGGTGESKQFPFYLPTRVKSLIGQTKFGRLPQDAAVKLEELSDSLRWKGISPKTARDFIGVNEQLKQRAEQTGAFWKIPALDKDISLLKSAANLAGGRLPFSYRGGLPEAVGGALDLVRYGSSGRKVVDPAFFGGAYATKTDRMGSNKSYYFVRGSSLGGDAERFRGNPDVQARISGDRIYDLNKDKLGILGLVNREQRDELLKERGYVGARINTEDGRDVAYLFRKLAVQPYAASKGLIPNLAGGLYHTSKYVPPGLLDSLHGMEMKISDITPHALKAWQFDRYGSKVGTITRNVTLDKSNIFEIATNERGAVSKVAMRVPVPGTELDRSLVLGMDGTLITTWLNQRGDTHRTLDMSRYSSAAGGIIPHLAGGLLSIEDVARRNLSLADLEALGKPGLVDLANRAGIITGGSTLSKASLANLIRNEAFQRHPQGNLKSAASAAQANRISVPFNLPTSQPAISQLEAGTARYESSFRPASFVSSYASLPPLSSPAASRQFVLPPEPRIAARPAPETAHEQLVRLIGKETAEHIKANRELNIKDKLLDDINRKFNSGIKLSLNDEKIFKENQTLLNQRKQTFEQINTLQEKASRTFGGKSARAELTRLATDETLGKQINQAAGTKLSISEQTRAQKQQQIGFQAAFAVPFLVTSLSTALGAKGRTGRIIEGGGEAIGTGALIASLFNFSPVGKGVGAAVAGLEVLKTVIENTVPSFEDLQEKVQNLSAANEQNINAAQGFLQAQENLKQVAQSGNAVQQQGAIKAFSSAALNIKDFTLRGRLLTGTQDEQSNAVIDAQAVANKKISKESFAALTAKFDKATSLIPLAAFKGFGLGFLNENPDLAKFITPIIKPISETDNRFNKPGQEDTLNNLASEFIAGGGTLQEAANRRNKGDPTFTAFTEAEFTALKERIVLLGQEKAELDKLSESTKTYNVNIGDLRKQLSIFAIRQGFQNNRENVQAGFSRDLLINRASLGLENAKDFFKPERFADLQGKVQEAKINSEGLSSINTILGDLQTKVTELIGTEEFINKSKVGVAGQDILSSIGEGNFTNNKALETLNSLLESEGIKGKDKKIVDTLEKLKEEVVQKIITVKDNLDQQLKVNEQQVDAQKELINIQNKLNFGGGTEGFLNPSSLTNDFSNIKGGFLASLNLNRLKNEVTRITGNLGITGEAGRATRFPFTPEGQAGARRTERGLALPSFQAELGGFQSFERLFPGIDAKSLLSSGLKKSVSDSLKNNITNLAQEFFNQVEKPGHLKNISALQEAITTEDLPKAAKLASQIAQANINAPLANDRQLGHNFQLLSERLLLLSKAFAQTEGAAEAQINLAKKEGELTNNISNLVTKLGSKEGINISGFGELITQAQDTVKGIGTSNDFLHEIRDLLAETQASGDLKTAKGEKVELLAQQDVLGKSLTERIQPFKLSRNSVTDALSPGDEISKYLKESLMGVGGRSEASANGVLLNIEELRQRNKGNGVGFVKDIQNFGFDSKTQNIIFKAFGIKNEEISQISTINDKLKAANTTIGEFETALKKATDVVNENTKNRKPPETTPTVPTTVPPTTVKPLIETLEEAKLRIDAEKEENRRRLEAKIEADKKRLQGQRNRNAYSQRFSNIFEAPSNLEGIEKFNTSEYERYFGKTKSPIKPENVQSRLPTTSPVLGDDEAIQKYENLLNTLNPDLKFDFGKMDKKAQLEYLQGLGNVAEFFPSKFKNLNSVGAGKLESEGGFLIPGDFGATTSPSKGKSNIYVDPNIGNRRLDKERDIAVGFSEDIHDPHYIAANAIHEFKHSMQNAGDISDYSQYAHLKFNRGRNENDAEGFKAKIFNPKDYPVTVTDETIQALAEAIQKAIQKENSNTIVTTSNTPQIKGEANLSFNYNINGTETKSAEEAADKVKEDLLVKFKDMEQRVYAVESQLGSPPPPKI